MSVTFDLPWKHPAVIVNALAMLLDVAYELVAILVITNLPPDAHVYFRAPLGGVVMAGMSLYCISDSNSMANLIVGYAMAALNFCGAVGFMVVGAAYVMGPNSILWRLVV